MNWFFTGIDDQPKVAAPGGCYLPLMTNSMQNKQVKFEWTFNNIRIEKIISTPISATIFFFWGFSSTRS